MNLPTPNASVILKEMSDGAVLYCPETEVYFGLNEVGLAIWKNLAPVSEAFETLVQGLARRFPDVDETTIRTDALEFLTDLETSGLVVPPEPTVTVS